MRRGPQNNQEAKCFWIFFVDWSIIDANLIFITPNYGTWCVQKGAHLKLGIVLLDFAGFLFWSAKWRDPQNIKESKSFTFFVDCSIVDAKLFFVPRYSVVSGALIEIVVHL